MKIKPAKPAAPPAASNLRIHTAANGYVVYTDTGPRSYDDTGNNPPHVFESFRALTAWMKKGLVQK